VAGLQGLGLTPHLLDAGLALNLSDGRTTLGWGREALRVPGLQLRVAALEGLSAAQGEQAQALRQAQAATSQALEAADTRADAQQRRAEALQRAIDLRPDRRWTAGLLVGADATATRHLGAYASRSWGPVHLQIVYLANTAAIGGGFRF